MNKRNKKSKQKFTFTKRCVAAILIVALADIQFSYILALLGKPEIAQTLSITIVTEIIGVMTGYFIKSYNETRREKSLEWQKEQFYDIEEIDSSNETDSDGSVG